VIWKIKLLHDRRCMTSSLCIHFTQIAHKRHFLLTRYWLLSVYFMFLSYGVYLMIRCYTGYRRRLVYALAQIKERLCFILLTTNKKIELRPFLFSLLLWRLNQRTDLHKTSFQVQNLLFILIFHVCVTRTVKWLIPWLFNNAVSTADLTDIRDSHEEGISSWM
jgi:hypothetical protein